MHTALKSNQLGLLISYSRLPLVAGCQANPAWRSYATPAAKPKSKSALTPTKAGAHPKVTQAFRNPAPTSAAKAPSASPPHPPPPSVPKKDPIKIETEQAHVASEQEKKTNNFMSEEEQLAQVEQILSMSRLFPMADPWGQSVDTLDVTIPYSVAPTSWKNYPTWGAVKDQITENRFNAAKNAISLLALAQADAIPGFDLSEAKTYEKYITSWPWRIFTTQSTSPKAWSTGLRKLALEAYKTLNFAIAQRNHQLVKRAATYRYQEAVLRTMKKSSPHLTYLWRFHKEVTPTRLLSIRATEGHLGIESPKFGNRMMVHALFKFDTEQSLEIYDKQGRAMHVPAAGYKYKASGLASTVPAEARRVTEFLVMEKRMWYDAPWVFREQLYEKPGLVSAL